MWQFVTRLEEKLVIAGSNTPARGVSRVQMELVIIEENTRTNVWTIPERSQLVGDLSSRMYVV